MNRALDIDVYFDLVCPWCLIGKSHLRRALELLGESDADVTPSVRWQSVQLGPNVPAEGWPFREFYEQRFGGKEGARERQAQILAAAEKAGVVIDYSRMRIFPNTAKAHRLLATSRWQLDADARERLLDRLFAAHFARGENLADCATLAAIAAEHGLDPEATRKALTLTGNLPAPPPVPGVPYFLLNRRYAISGAHPADVLHSAMRQALAG